jgi:hypothetical protein
MNRIIFDPKSHSYTKGSDYMSVSRLISKYKNPFDRDYWSSYKALERLIPNFKEIKKEAYTANEDLLEYALKETTPDLFVEMKGCILKEWDAENLTSINKGNIYHLKKEQNSYANGVELNPFDGKEYKVIPKQEVTEQKVALIEDLFDLEDGYYPELILWNDQYKIAGQADKVFIETVGAHRYIDCDDYKSNKKISKHGYKGQKMKNPLGHLQDANHTHYCLQISTYAWLLEEFGYKVRNLSFHHYNQQYPINYMHREVKLMLDAR